SASRKHPSVDLVTKSVTKTRRDRFSHTSSAETAVRSQPRSRRCAGLSVRLRKTPGAPLRTPAIAGSNPLVVVLRLIGQTFPRSGDGLRATRSRFRFGVVRARVLRGL